MIGTVSSDCCVRLSLYDHFDSQADEGDDSDDDEGDDSDADEGHEHEGEDASDEQDSEEHLL